MEQFAKPSVRIREKYAQTPTSCIPCDGENPVNGQAVRGPLLGSNMGYGYPDEFHVLKMRLLDVVLAVEMLLCNNVT